VREHGGALRVETAPGAGATFVVELPAAAPADLAEGVGG
jgi:signal transduction histidine kinase